MAQAWRSISPRKDLERLMQTTHYEISLPEGANIRHPLSALDLSYAGSGNAIGLGYIFEHDLDSLRLLTSLQTLASKFPALAGRLDVSNKRVSSEIGSFPFTHVKDFPGRYSDLTDPKANITIRTDFVPEPSLKSAIAGKAPLMSVKLTSFKQGGSILGVSVNHALMDAWGFHQLMRQWADIFTGKPTNNLTMGHDLYKFRTSRNASEWRTELQNQGVNIPTNYNRFAGRNLLRFLNYMVNVYKLRGREMFHFSADQIQTIKTQVHTESGLDWISTNMALSAHILNAIIPLQMPKKSKSLGIGNVINIRGRIRKDSQFAQNNFAGNALYIKIDHSNFDRPVRALARGDIARLLRQSYDAMSENHIETTMANIVDGLELGYGYPGLSITDPIMAINNQSKFDVYNVDFGVGRPVRILPQDVGDHIMIFPASDGGAEVYIRDFGGLKRQKKLLEPFWTDRILGRTTN